ncbi:DNA-binding response regulator in two-component regulatory system with QseC [Rhodospirillaceae bacterium LM-1]|nr:DNA-binding response regulator in two-component regulatory system with QseC [Rhodospirillaceae bacterium LM-1]
MRILVVEDEPHLAELVRDHLSRVPFAVDLACCLDEGMSLLAANRYDAIVLDRGLPDGDGIELLRLLRVKGDATPVLAATARDQITDRIHGLDLGMDDYLVKPYDLGELTARLKALLRRAGQTLGGVQTAGNVTLDTVRGSAEVEGRPVALARRQLMLLETLMRSAGRVVSRQHIEDSLYGIDDLIDSNALEANISRLRKMLADQHASVTIHTVRGVGYMLSEDKSA